MNLRLTPENPARRKKTGTMQIQRGGVPAAQKGETGRS
jgi:hypothetical protein